MSSDSITNSLKKPPYHSFTKSVNKPSNKFIKIVNKAFHKLNRNFKFTLYLFNMFLFFITLYFIKPPDTITKY